MLSSQRGASDAARRLAFPDYPGNTQCRLISEFLEEIHHQLLDNYTVYRSTSAQYTCSSSMQFRILYAGEREWFSYR